MFEQEGKHSSAADRLFPRPTTWESWLKEYTEAEYIDDRISLLHSGLNIRGGADPVIFYLKEAEGHARAYKEYFQSDGDSAGRFEARFGTFNRVAEARQQIAKTAFNMLVTHFFKDTKESYESFPSWFGLASVGSVMDALLHFFRLNGDHFFVNLSGWKDDLPPHKAAVVREFLGQWALYPWMPFPSSERGVRQSVEESFRERRERFIEVLCGMRSLDVLLKYRGMREDIQAGELELKKLEELALSQEYSFPKAYPSEGRRRPATIEEAAFAGSQAGTVAILLRSQLKERKRFDELLAARRDRENARRRLEANSSM